MLLIKSFAVHNDFTLRHLMKDTEYNISHSTDMLLRVLRVSNFTLYCFIVHRVFAYCINSIHCCCYDVCVWARARLYDVSCIMILNIKW